MRRDADALILASKRASEELQALTERAQQIEAKQLQILEGLKQAKKTQK
jgi:hypothetical protein